MGVGPPFQQHAASRRLKGMGRSERIQIPLSIIPALDARAGPRLYVRSLGLYRVRVMRNIKHEILLWVHIISIVLIWAAILYLTGTGLAINWEALKKLPDVVTVYVILSVIFTKWLWRVGNF